MRSKRPSSSTVYVRISSKEDASDQIHKTYYDTTPHALALILDREAERGDSEDADNPHPDVPGSPHADAASPPPAAHRAQKNTLAKPGGKG